jgi:hypothetical protein
MVETSGHGVRTMGRGCKGEGRRRRGRSLQAWSE